MHATPDHIGWEAQGDGRWFYGLNVENGRVADTSRMRLKSALRQICRQLSPGIRLTAHQSLLLTDLQEQRSAAARSDLARASGAVERGDLDRPPLVHGVCGLAHVRAGDHGERAGIAGNHRPDGIGVGKLGLAQEAFTVRMTGCPNGCARPYNADIGLVGKARAATPCFWAATGWAHD